MKPNPKHNLRPALLILVIAANLLAVLIALEGCGRTPGPDLPVRAETTPNTTTFTNLFVVSDATIGGGLAVSEGAEIGGDLALAGDLTLEGGLGITGKSELSEDLSVEGSLTVTGTAGLGDDVEIAGGLTVGGDLSAAGSVSTRGDLGAAGDLRLDGDATVTGTLTAAGITVTGPASFTDRINIDARLEVSATTLFEDQVEIQNTLTLSHTIVQGDLYVQGTDYVAVGDSPPEILPPGLAVDGDVRVSGWVRAHKVATYSYLDPDFFNISLREEDAGRWWINASTDPMTFTLPLPVTGTVFCFATLGDVLTIQPDPGSKFGLSGATNGQAVDSDEEYANLCIMAANDAVWLVISATPEAWDLVVPEGRPVPPPPYAGRPAGASRRHATPT